MNFLYIFQLMQFFIILKGIQNQFFIFLKKNIHLQVMDIMIIQLNFYQFNLILYF